jgi:hypothetical protein
MSLNQVMQSNVNQINLNQPLAFEQNALGLRLKTSI